MDNTKLNELVAERVMGEPRPTTAPRDSEILTAMFSCGRGVESAGGNWYWACYYEHGDAPECYAVPFCEDIGAAFKVVERMEARDGWLSTNFSRWLESYLPPGCYTAHFGFVLADKTPKQYGATGNTLMRAICLAALRVVGVEVPK